MLEKCYCQVLQMCSFAREICFPNFVSQWAMSVDWEDAGVWNFKVWVLELAMEDIRTLKIHQMMNFRKHISSHWDKGAWNTFYKYYEDKPIAEILKFLTTYFSKYYNKTTSKWDLCNPSAACVAICRFFFISSERKKLENVLENVLDQF